MSNPTCPVERDRPDCTPEFHLALAADPAAWKRLTTRLRTGDYQLDECGNRLLELRNCCRCQSTISREVVA